MRIETFNAAATCEENTWVFETMTKEDGLSHLSGLAEIEVTRDEVVRLEPPPGYKGQIYGHRIIEGTVKQRLFMWNQSVPHFGHDHFLGGINLPEEDHKRYQMNECAAEYDDETNVLKLTCLERIHD